MPRSIAIELNSLDLKIFRARIRYQLKTLCAHRLTEGALSGRILFDGRDFLDLLGRLEWSDLTRGLGPRLCLFLAFDRFIPLLRRYVERIGFSDEGGSFLRNEQSRSAGRSNDRGVPLV